MRTEKEIMDLILNFAKNDQRIRIVSMGGSRVNKNVSPDKFQDYDIVYVVSEIESFKSEASWINVFGERVILQTPEAMDMFPPSLGNWFTYLMQFVDGTRIDLMLVPLDELNKYIQSDKLIKILLDKDNLVPKLPPPTDKDYWVKKPTEKIYDDCSNEFWWLSTYVHKGLSREELLYAIYHLDIMRQMLLIMLSWEASIKTDFSKSMGKNYKYLDKYIDNKKWSALLETYKNNTPENIKNSFWLCMDLFRESSLNVSKFFNFKYPDYDFKVTNYITTL